MGFVNGFLTVLGFGLGLVAVFAVFCVAVIVLNAWAKHIEVKKVDAALTDALKKFTESSKGEQGKY